MEIFKTLADMKSAKPTTNVIKENIYPEINGTLLITKGAVSLEISYYGRLTPMYKLEDYIVIDDLDYEVNYEKLNINELEIDDINKFRQGLIDHGMKSVADSLTLTESEIFDEINKAIPNHKYYKSLYGDKPYYTTLTDEEKKKIHITEMCKDITYRQDDNYFKKQFGWVNENNEVLTNAEIIEQYYK